MPRLDKMIWDDPWIVAAATDRGGTSRRFCTTIPPPPAPLPTEMIFRVSNVGDIGGALLAAWIDLTGTRWTATELRQRLGGAHVPLLVDESGTLVGTCVLRRPTNFATDTWLLETLRARRGYGTALLRATIRWIWDTAGPNVLTYVWELTGAQLLVAWWRGWLASAAAFQYGWVWRSSGDCGFCGRSVDRRWNPIRTDRLVLPTLVGDAKTGNWAIVSDSGLGDGWGYVSAWRGVPNWTEVAARGEWRALWCRSETAPTSASYSSAWRWSGEFVIIGALNLWDPKMAALEWVTAEIAV